MALQAMLRARPGVHGHASAAALNVKPNSVGTILARAERALRERYLAMHPNAGEEYGGGR